MFNFIRYNEEKLNDFINEWEKEFEDKSPDDYFSLWTKVLSKHPIAVKNSNLDSQKAFYIKAYRMTSLVREYLKEDISKNPNLNEINYLRMMLKNVQKQEEYLNWKCKLYIKKYDEAYLAIGKNNTK